MEIFPAATDNDLRPSARLDIWRAIHLKYNKQGTEVWISILGDAGRARKDRYLQ